MRTFGRMVKRIIAGIVGLLGTALLPAVVVDAALNPSVDRIRGAIILGFGSTIGPLLLTRVDGWTAWTQRGRLVAMFVLSASVPVLLSLAADFRYGASAWILSAPVAVGVTSLWWSVRGHRLGDDST